MTQKTIAVLAGDGIGPEIMAQAIKVLKAIEQKFNHEFIVNEADIGGIAIDNHGKAFPESTIQACKDSDAILLGSMGGPKWDSLPPNERPERAALLPLRKTFDLYANLRPVTLYKELVDSSPLKQEITKDGFDFVIVRELTGGIYFGEKKSGDDFGADEMKYTTKEIERIAKVAFDIAKKRGNKLLSVDKSNVLTTSVHWRNIMEEYAKKHPEVQLDSLYVDNAAMQIIRDPHQFDTVVTGNMFGDILSDEASVLSGSLGMMPSASLNESNFGVYEPAGGSAPDIAGQNSANPIAQILCAAMMLRYSFDMKEEADTIENAVKKTLEQGFRTADIMQDSCTKLGTDEIGDKIVENL